MRFIHTGDIHLGATPESKRPWAANRGDEIWNTLERLIKKKNRPGRFAYYCRGYVSQTAVAS